MICTNFHSEGYVVERLFNLAMVLSKLMGKNQQVRAGESRMDSENDLDKHYDAILAQRYSVGR